MAILISKQYLLALLMVFTVVFLTYVGCAEQERVVVCALTFDKAKVIMNTYIELVHVWIINVPSVS